MSQGQGGGRPRVFESVEELDRRAEVYFASISQVTTIPATEDEPERTETTTIEPPTAYGLSIACGTTWETMRDYRSGKYDKEDQKFSLSVKWWVEQIKYFAEKSLYTARSPAGPIFHIVNLTRNDGEAAWKNAQSNEHSGPDGGPIEFRNFMESLKN